MICCLFCSWICFLELTYGTAFRHIVACSFPLWRHDYFYSADTERLLYVKLCFSCGQYILANGSALELMLFSGITVGIHNLSGRDPEPSELRAALAFLQFQIAVLCCCGGPFIMPWQQRSPSVHSLLRSPRHFLCPIPSQVSALPADTVSSPLLTPSTPAASTPAVLWARTFFLQHIWLCLLFILRFWMLKIIHPWCWKVGKYKTHQPTNQECCCLVLKIIFTVLYHAVFHW